MTVSEVTIEKYLKGITSITMTVGKLDVLRVMLKEKYNDDIVDTILLSIIKELTNVTGITYQIINTEKKSISSPVTTQVFNSKIENSENNAPKIENTYKYISEEKKAEIKNDNKNIIGKTLANIGQKLSSKKEDKKQENKGIYYNDKGEMEYDFIYSTSLSYMRYNRDTKELIIRFKNNMRTYKYYNVPIHVFDNLHTRDEFNKHAGKYFRQEIYPKWKKGSYEEITDTELIG